MDDDDDEYGDEVLDATERIEEAIYRVEHAIKEKWSGVQWFGAAVIVFLLWSWAEDIWHSKWRYAQTYGVRQEDVQVQKKPHDCNFFAAPLGEKYCHYERTVSTVRWALHPQKEIPSFLTMMARLGASSTLRERQSRNPRR